MVSSLPSELEALLVHQAGVVDTQQLRQHGFGSNDVASRVRSGRWQRLLPRVYATFSGPIPSDARTWAALLYAGPGATLSHQSAAWVWGLTDGPSDVVQVTIGVDRRRLANLGWVRIHYAHRLEWSRHPTNVPAVTTVDDTVLDLVDRASTRSEVVRWVTRACQRRRTTPERLALTLDSRKKIRWRDLMQAILADVSDGAETPLEIAYVRRVESSHGLPRAHRQRHRRVGGKSQWIDAEYEAFGLIVELDGRVGHVEDGAFRDRQRDNVSTLRRRSTLRYGWTEVYDSPCAVAAEIIDILRRNGWSDDPKACGPTCQLRAAAA
ncbi:PDDEXK family nuclease [Tenggerimyces flavus]|uniref:DUF559 domain-containing protein n=1 Tax=Tenggerimyces flavus TaxID=1708749 RepID=A0ABV7YEA3_9ACTN|nr:hypothetical protein [Tenggerimyces flavus]MBM7787870.1 hypothetical protein [Tenggerimyces flavus]